MTESTFVGEEIEVRVEGDAGHPVSFVWRGEEHVVGQIVTEWRRLDLGRRPWWSRRHRDHYVVRTDGGRVFEIYRHRGPGRRYWVLLKELHDPST